MATGAWMGGLLYDHFGSYTAAFHAGIASNVANLALISFLVLRQYGRHRLRFAAA
jgi:predicted MFS family arabinose efflux permease